jgi:ABC-type branched-subunit amino acid transport system ATPase component/ABC-type branched-subunit amino acid transport system permease subunit
MLTQNSGLSAVNKSVIVVIVALAAMLPLLTSSSYILFIATQLCVFFLVALGLNVLTGYGGQTSIGHGALVAVGAYVVALGMVDYKLSFWLVFPLAIFITTIFGVLMAMPAFRLSAWYFALITMGFASVVQSLLTEWQPLTHGFAGVVGIPMPRVGSYVFKPRDLYWTLLVFSLCAFLVTRNVIHSRYGRALQGLRDNPLAAIGSGASLVRLKLFGFVYSAILAGAAGAFLAVQKSVITPDDFSIDTSIFFLLVVVLGGLGSIYGPLLGTLAFFLLPELLAQLQSWRLLVYGIGLLILTLYAPDGIAGAINIWRKRPNKRLPREPSQAAVVGEIPTCKGIALSVQGVSKKFGGVAALSDISIDVGSGEIHALIGTNGSGKTTLLNLVTGFYSADSGVIKMDGREVQSNSPVAIARAGVRRTFQTPKLINDLTILDNVLLGAFGSEKVDLVSIALDLPNARREKAQRRAEALQYLGFVGLDSRAYELAGEVPHGQQRLAEIARALLARPRLLLLDEPAAGLSMSELDGLIALIGEISKLGTTIIVVEHHMDLVTSLASSVTVMDRGRILASGEPDTVFKDTQVMTAFMGTRSTQQTGTNDAA